MPVIGADWWEPICDPVNGKLYGQVQLLVAFGSEKQIQNLEINRGFHIDKVVAKKFVHTNTIQKLQNISIKPKTPTKKKIITKKPEAQKKQDKEVQFDTKMDVPNEENVSINKDTLGEFLSQLIQQRQTVNYVEHGTNTDHDENKQNANSNACNVAVEDSTQVRQTSELLDTLEQALSVNSNTLFADNESLNKNNNYFKAHICIEKALHLPAKKKCKVKKTKGKNIKPEDIPPTCYVTCETTPNEMKTTSVVQRNCNPIWDYRCDCLLPSDLLLNVSCFFFKH